MGGRKMKKNALIILILILPLFISCKDKKQPMMNDFQYGYNYASENDVDNFKECQNYFGTGDAEDGCNEYVKEYHTGYKSFKGTECTEDCRGHEAGYNWAEENDISDEDDCDGNSESFIEGCKTYVNENY